MTETFSQRIKEDIARFVAEPSREGLTALIRFFGGEFDQYELKEAWPPIQAIAKTTLAIANSGGGVIIFGIRDATLEPVGLVEYASKQAVFDTFRSYIPSTLLKEVTLLDFDYTDATYAPLRGKKLQVLAIPDLPEAIPFVCEDEWHKDNDHIRRAAVYVRSGTNTREATYDQVQAIIGRRLEQVAPPSSTRHLRQEIEQLQVLFAARDRYLKLHHEEEPEAAEIESEFPRYLDTLIDHLQARIERTLDIDEPAR